MSGADNMGVQRIAGPKIGTMHHALFPVVKECRPDWRHPFSSHKLLRHYLIYVLPLFPCFLKLQGGYLMFYYSGKYRGSKKRGYENIAKPECTAGNRIVRHCRIRRLLKKTKNSRKGEMI